MRTIGAKPRLVPGFEMMRTDQDSTDKDEGELIAEKRLIADIRSSYPKLIDVVVYDALACNSKWINHCLDSKDDCVVRAKKNNNNSIKTIKKKVNKLDPVAVWCQDK